MQQIARSLRAMAAGIGLAGALFAGPALAEDTPSAYQDIQATLGTVPAFFKLFPEEGIAGAWAEFKGIQLNPNTALSGKEKELIGLAVAAQIPCTYCIYAHTSAAKFYGATDREIRETVAMAAITRHWSTVLNGTQADQVTFRKDFDDVLRLAAERMKTSSAK